MMSISPKDIWQSSGYKSVLGNKSSYPLRQIWVYVSNMANDYRNHWAFGKTISSRIVFSVILIRFDLALSHKSCTEEEINGESLMGQAWKKRQTAQQLVMVRSRTNSKHTGNSTGETDSIYDSHTSQVIEQARGKRERGPRASFGV